MAEISFNLNCVQNMMCRLAVSATGLQQPDTSCAAGAEARGGVDLATDNKVTCESDASERGSDHCRPPWSGGICSLARTAAWTGHWKLCAWPDE